MVSNLEAVAGQDDALLQSIATALEITRTVHRDVTNTLTTTDIHERLKILTYTMHGINRGGLGFPRRAHRELVKLVLCLLEAILDHAAIGKTYLETVTDGKVVIVTSLAALIARYRRNLQDIEHIDSHPKDLAMKAQVTDEELWRMVKLIEDKAAKLVELLSEHHPPEVAFVQCNKSA